MQEKNKENVDANDELECGGSTGACGRDAALYEDAVAFAKAVVVPFKQHAVLGQIVEAIRWPWPESYRVQLLAPRKGVCANPLDAARKDDKLYIVRVFKRTFANIFNAVGQQD